jgi:hypothetical protein
VEPAAAVDTADSKRGVDSFVVIEVCRHGDAEAQADRAEEHARALDVDEPSFLVARDALRQRQDEVMFDWLRFTGELFVDTEAPLADSARATRLRGTTDSAIALA